MQRVAGRVSAKLQELQNAVRSNFTQSVNVGRGTVHAISQQHELTAAKCASFIVQVAGMSQRWCRGLRPLTSNLRQFHTSSSSAAALPALSDVQSGASSFLSKLFGGQPSRSLVPMTEQLSGVSSSFLDSPPSDAPKTELTTLGNGFKVATEATIVSISCFCCCGSSDDAGAHSMALSSCFCVRDQLPRLASMWMRGVSMRNQCRLVRPKINRRVFKLTCTVCYD